MNLGGNSEDNAKALLGKKWRVNLADADAFAGIACIFSQVAGSLAEQVEESQLAGAKSCRLDMPEMAAQAKANSQRARAPSLVFTPM